MHIFRLTTADPAALDLSASVPENIPEFVAHAKSHNVIASVSVGGWSGSRYFSQAVTSQNRSTFVKTILDMVDKYQFDGVDFE